MMKHLGKIQSEFSKLAMEFTSIEPVVTPERGLNSRELARTIRLAISAEHDAVHLYETIADSTDDERVKKLMQDVADEEKVHEGEFQQLLDTIDSKNRSLQDSGREEAHELIEQEHAKAN